MGEFWSGGGKAYSVASLCWIMSSLLKMTSLTPETDSTTASFSPPRLNLTFGPHRVSNHSLMPYCFMPFYRSATELTSAVSWCGATFEEVRERAIWPQSCKCEGLAKSAGGTVLAVYTVNVHI